MQGDSTTRKVRVLPDPGAVAAAAAVEFALRAREAVEAHGMFGVALAGGSTPRATYRLLAEGGDPPDRERVPWDRARVFFGDERHVPPDHRDSNYRMAFDTLLSKVRPGSVHRYDTELPDVALAARSYETALRRALPPGPGEVPRFDLVLLGLGADGHTASLFPGSEALRQTDRLVAVPWVEKLRSYRFTLTPIVLNSAAHVMFLVSGADKAEALREVLEGEDRPERLPAQSVRPKNGSVLWLVDRDASSLLSTGH
jgi:6-phosphogluconolactonase